MSFLSHIRRLGLLAAVTIVIGSGCSHFRSAPAPVPPKAVTAAPAQTNAAVSTAKTAPATNDADEVYLQMRLLTRALIEIRKDYVDPSKTDYKSLIYSALHGMVESLDPHSQFLEPDMYEDIKNDTSGEYGGIGIVIGLKDNLLTVIAPMEDTPAYRAGILAGDRIMEMDGTKTEGVNLRDAVHKMRGAKDTKITLKILRGREKDLREFKLVREQIKMASIKGTRMLDDRIGYIRITQFSENTAGGLQEAIDKLGKQNMKALVLDLRNNPGGLLTAAIEVSQKFLRAGDLIVVTRGRDPKKKLAEASAGGSIHLTDFPMVILINGGTASASEIVSGALQDHKRAVLLGEKTFGKASVQSVLPLDEVAAIRLTTAHYYTPSERIIHEKGIEPDITVPVPPEEWQKVLVKRARLENPEMFIDDNSAITNELASVTDRQLERAMDVLKGIMAFTPSK